MEIRRRAAYQAARKAESFAAYEDGYGLLELTRKHYQQAALDVRQLDLLIR
jgi:hypothetical protein